MDLNLKKNIAIISTSSASPWGGSEELWLAIAEQAMKDGHKVSVSVYKWPKLHPKVLRIQKVGIPVFFRNRINYPDIKGKIIGKLNQFLFAKNQLDKFININRSDFLIISMGAFCELEVEPIRKFLLTLKIPYFLIIHSNTENHTVPLQKIDQIQLVCKNAKYVFFVSKRILQQAERQIAYKFNNAQIAINPLNIDEIGVLSYPDYTPVQFACVGTLLVSVKGQAMLLQLLSSEKWMNRDWVLNIYGNGPDRILLDRLIDSFGMRRKVILHGFSNDIRNDVWAKNHILLMPSYVEGMPISLIEAMLCGRTAVVTDVGGNRELIGETSAVYIAEAATIYSFDKALELAWNSRANWEAIGKKAFDVANNYYLGNPASQILDKIINYSD